MANQANFNPVSLGRSRILGLGIHEPEEIIQSDDVFSELNTKERFGVPHTLLRRTLGVVQRRVAPPDAKPSDLACPAAQEALERAALHPKDIDLLIFAGMNRDCIEPSTAHRVADRIGAKRAVCLDLSNACHGFMNGIHYANALIRIGDIKYALICTGENNWRIARRAFELCKATNDKSEFFKWCGGLSVGDAGASMVLGPREELDGEGFESILMCSRSEYHNLCIVETDPLSEEVIVGGHMDMVSITREHVAIHRENFDFFINSLGWSPADIDYFVHHQVGRRVFYMHSDYSGIPLDRFSDTFTKYGNITSATIPFNLYKIRQKINTAIKVFISGSGSGLSTSQSGYVFA